ncbi:MAG TPA: hypothetical protein VGA31_07090 [Thermoanaerobaculia bacterium]
MKTPDKETIALALAVAAAFLAWLTFWTNLKVRRVEWLSRLYESFYVRPELKAIRATLDYPGPKLDRLHYCIVSDPDNSAELEPLVDYLNFFEFIAVLKRMSQLSEKEIRLIFGYYLGELAKDSVVLKFCRDGGFKNLLALLGKLNDGKQYEP